jgi:hypothetical protein
MTRGSDGYEARFVQMADLFRSGQTIADADDIVESLPMWKTEKTTKEIPPHVAQLVTDVLGREMEHKV